LLKPGTNTVHLRLFAYANTGGGVSEAFVGPEHTLRPLFERRFLFQTILPQISNILGVALGVFVLLLWTRHNADSVDIYFCLLALIWAARGTYLFVRDIPVSAFHWELFTLSSLGVCAVLGVFMMMRYSGWRLPRLERAVWIYLLAGPPMMWLAGPQHLYTVASLWVIPTVVGMVFFAGVMTREACVRVCPPRHRWRRLRSEFEN
jgi:two-component system, NarL family, sensor histidine kinase UhpB